MANWPIDPGKQIQWAKQPEYTTRLLSLVASLDNRADQHCVFTPKGTGKGRIIADITDRLFCTLPYDHDRVEKQRASVQRRINQIGSNYQSDIRALQYDPYRVQPVLDNIRVYNPHWDLIRSILHDHPDFPHWDPDEPDQFLKEQEEQDDRLGRAQMQDVDYHPVASGSGLHQQPPPPPPPRAPTQALPASTPISSNPYRHDNYNARLDDHHHHTDANAVAGPSNPKPIPSYKYPAAAAAAAAASGPIASGSGSTPASAFRSGSGSGSGGRPSGALKRPRSSSSGNRSPSPQRRYVPEPANTDTDAAVAARERQLAAREQAVIDGYKRIGLGSFDVTAAAVPQPFGSLAAREAAIEERERQLEEAIVEIARFDAYEDLQRQAEAGQPPPPPPAAAALAAPAAVAAPAPVPPPVPPPAAQAAPANANAPPDSNANANQNQNHNHDVQEGGAAAVPAELDDNEPPLLAECPKCSFPLSAVPSADAESHLRACLDSEGASLAECPVCEASLSGMESAAERERHVDACCRGLGTTTAAGADESTGSGARAALASSRGSGEAKRQKREHVVFVSDEKTIPKDETTGEPLECIMCFDEFEAEQRLARLSCYCLYHEECIVSYWENPSKFCPTHRELDTTPEMQMRAI